MNFRRLSNSALTKDTFSRRRSDRGENSNIGTTQILSNLSAAFAAQCPELVEGSLRETIFRGGSSDFCAFCAFLRPSLLILAILFAGCGNDNGQIGDFRYRSDMYEQPSYRKHEDPLRPVAGTVPVGGKELAIPDSATAAKLVNPVRYSPDNADSSKALFETYCTPCHGLGGKGDGLVAAKFQTPPDLTTRKYRNAPDGYIYFVIRNGRLIMPAHFESVKARERWMIVNHVRTLQGK